MGVGKGILWKGSYYVKPQAASYIDSSALSPVQLGNGNKLVIMGNMTGLLPPLTLMSVTPSTVDTVLHPSCTDARLACKLAFNPSKGGVPGASQIYLMAVNNSTDASYSTSSYSVNSYMYGVAANQIQIKQESIDDINTGTVVGTKITITFQDTIEVLNVPTKESFSVQYTGLGSDCQMVITPSTGLVTTCTGALSDNLSLDFSIYNTIQMLVDAINATPNYTATVITSTPKIDLCTELDQYAIDIKIEQTAQANLQAVIDAINSRSGYIQAHRTGDILPANYDSTRLSGGTDGDHTLNDLQEACNILKTVDIQMILFLTTDMAYITAIDEHCQWMSGPVGKSERVQFAGGENETWTNAISRLNSLKTITSDAKILNSDRTMYVGLGSRHYDQNGEAQLYPAYITAAMYAGLCAGADPTEPLTRKYLNCLGLEVDLNIDEINEMIEAGVAVPVPDMVQGVGYVISRGVTTWSGDADLLKIEMSIRRGCDYIAKEVRNRHELLVGKKGSEGMDITIINITNAVLEAAKRAEMIRSFDPKATQLRAEGLTRYIDYSAVPIMPINWIFSVYHLLPLNITITL